MFGNSPLQYDFSGKQLLLRNSPLDLANVIKCTVRDQMVRHGNSFDVGEFDFLSKRDL